MKSDINNRNELTPSQALTLNRRRFLRGLGACVALPFLESVNPLRLQAAVAKAASPVRMAFFYFPNGANQGNWWPKTPGKDFELSPTMAPLAKVKHRVNVFGNLEHINATAGKDGAGDHARASATFLTGMRAKKTAGADISVGVSVDQLVAQRIGHLTRFPSLELTCDAVRKSGSCDSGYSCAYDYNISWKSPTMPMAPEPNPRLVFERLFGSGRPGERQKNYSIRQEQQKSILDFVMDDARSLQKQLAGRDKSKLDEYLTGVREIEQRIQRTEKFGKTPDPKVETPAGVPSSFEEHIQLMCDILALAFQTDSTRVATLIMAHDGANRSFNEIGIPEGHHYLSHHQGNKEKLEKIAKIDLFYMQQFARFLEKLENTKDADGNSVLHNSMIVYGCGNGDGNRHNHDNLPVIMAGSGGGAFGGNQFHKLDRTPMSNLFLSMVDQFGLTNVERFGDSTGRLKLA
jgi:hypothetical protein